MKPPAAAYHVAHNGTKIVDKGVEY